MQSLINTIASSHKISFDILNKLTKNLSYDQLYEIIDDNHKEKMKKYNQDKNKLFTKYLVDRNIKKAYKIMKSYEDVKFDTEDYYFTQKFDMFLECFKEFENIFIDLIHYSNDKEEIKLIEIIKYTDNKNNIIHCSDCGCNNIIMHYPTEYFKKCIELKKYEMARLLYINFNIKAEDVLIPSLFCKFNYIWHIIKNVQKIIPIERQGFPNIPLINLINGETLREHVMVYYSLNPQAFTKEAITDIIRFYGIKKFWYLDNMINE